MSSVQVTITQLPAAGPITGTESVPIVQNGQTVQTTTAAIAASPSQTQTFLTLNQEPTLPNSRRLSGGTGIGLVDGGAQSTLQITLNGASGSLETASNGFIVKTGASTVTNRVIQVSGDGLSITNGNGQTGNPVISLSGLSASLASMSGSGLVAVLGGATVTPRSIDGTANQIAVANGNAFAGNPTIGLASNAIFPGTGAVTLPIGTNAQEPAGSNGQIRFNSDMGAFYGYSAGQWRQFSTAGGVTEVDTGTGLLGGPITSTGTISIDNTVVATLSDSQTLTNKTISGSSNSLSNIGNSSLTNSSITINGSSVSLGGTATITANTANALTIGTGLSGTSFNGSSAVTIAIDSTVATLAGTQTLTNKSISGSDNTLTNIPNSALTNSSLTIGSTAISLGGTSLTLAGLTSVSVTQDPTSALELATKQYVDSIASGLNYHQPVSYASTTALPAYTYNNGASGVGATITANANGALSFGGGSPSAGQRLLVKNEAGANEPYNGVYTVTQAGSAGTPFILTRATDYDSSGTGTNEIDAGDYVLVLYGTNASTAWVQQTPLPITVGTTGLVFLQFNSPVTYTAGTGLNLSPVTQFNISDTSVTAASYGSASSVATFTVNAQGQLTSASTTSIAIANTQVSGLGTMSTQNANSVAITGGAIDGTAIGASSQSTVKATTLTTTGAGSAADGAGQIYLNGSTSNRVEWSAVGTGAPAFTTRTAGTKLLLYPAISGSQVDYAIGINSATMWSSVPVASSSFYFKWYGGQTEVASMDGTGAFTATSFAGAGTGLTGTASMLDIGGNAATATSATNTTITASSANADYYITVVSDSTGNRPQLVATGLTANPSTGKITSGVSGGTF